MVKTKAIRITTIIITTAVIITMTTITIHNYRAAVAVCIRRDTVLVAEFYMFTKQCALFVGF